MKFSSGYVKGEADYGVFPNLSNGKMRIFGATTEPATADAAETGTLLGELTLAGGAYTAETRAEYKITLSGSSGSVDTIKVGAFGILPAAVNFITDLNTTAAAVATAINNSHRGIKFPARSSGADVFVKVPPATGTLFNAITITTTATTMSATVAGDATPSGSGGTVGIAAVNGINFQYPPVSGVLTKETGLWQDSSANASGSSVYARILLDGADDFSSSTVYRRIQLSIGTSGADITSQILTTVIGTPITLSVGTYTIPASA